jgi:hypothetical protein
MILFNKLSADVWNCPNTYSENDEIKVTGDL